MKWVTRERPRIDRIACPWLVKRFIDPAADFLFVPQRELAAAVTAGAIPFDVPGTALFREEELCTFEVFLMRYRLRDPALHRLAAILRRADRGHLDLSAEGAGLLGLSLGLAVSFDDDHEMLAYGLVVYDALYGWIIHTPPDGRTNGVAFA